MATEKTIARMEVTWREHDANQRATIALVRLTDPVGLGDVYEVRLNSACAASYSNFTHAYGAFLQFGREWLSRVEYIGGHK